MRNHTNIISFMMFCTNLQLMQTFVEKKTIKIWDVHVDNIIILKLFKTKNKCNYLLTFLLDIEMML